MSRLSSRAVAALLTVAALAAFPVASRAATRIAATSAARTEAAATTTETAAATAAPTAAVTRAPDWIINQGAVDLLGTAGLSRAQLQELFGNDRTYLTHPLDSAITAVHGAVGTVTFTSYQTLKSDIGSLPAGTGAVLFDIEHWSLTPAGEQRAPATYEKLAAALVHKHHLLFVTAPATDLTDVLAPDNPDHYAAYLSLGLAASGARYADAIDIQAQGSEADLSKFRNFVEAAAAQARRANPHVTVFAGISTNPSGQHITSTQLTNAFDAVRGFVAGYWLNIPAAGTACPDCGTPQPQVAVPLLRSLLRAHA
jgi:hypothetical protein